MPGYITIHPPHATVNIQYLNKFRCIKKHFLWNPVNWVCYHCSAADPPTRTHVTCFPKYILISFYFTSWIHPIQDVKKMLWTYYVCTLLPSYRKEMWECQMCNNVIGYGENRRSVFLYLFICILCFFFVFSQRSHG